MFCRLCNSSDVEKIYNACNMHGRHIVDSKDNFEIYRCNDCKAIFIADIVVDSEYYSKYYPKNYYDDGLSNSIISRLINSVTKLSIRSKERIILNNLELNKKFKTKIKILDIGCGKGGFLSTIRNDVFDKYGIEINSEGYRICKQQKIQLYNQELKNINFEYAVFDIITLWHVIEHLDKSNEIMILIKRILKKEGILVIATPNTNSIGFMYGYNNWFHLDSPRHLILYNAKSLEYLLNKSGFEIVQEKNLFYDFPLDLFWSVRKSWMKYFICPLYPFFKFFSKETLLFICKKSLI